MILSLSFESFVNSEESKTEYSSDIATILFESFVNSEESKTQYTVRFLPWKFESFVNSEESKTSQGFLNIDYSLRALLIQKRVKPWGFIPTT